jgi:hypothetical protein
VTGGRGLRHCLVGKNKNKRKEIPVQAPAVHYADVVLKWPSFGQPFYARCGPHRSREAQPMRNGAMKRSILLKSADLTFETGGKHVQRGPEGIPLDMGIHRTCAGLAPSGLLVGRCTAMNCEGRLESGAACMVSWFLKLRPGQDKRQFEGRRATGDWRRPAACQHQSKRSSGQ